MSSFRLTKNFAVVDIGSQSLKIAEYQRVGEKITLLRYEIIPLPQDLLLDQPLSLQEITPFIQNSIKRLGIKATETISEVTGPWTVARNLLMTNLPDDEMREAIRWGSQGDFPFPLEEAIIDFFKVEVAKQEDGEEKVEIVTTVATRELVEKQLNVLREGGLKPLFLSIPPISLMQTYRVTQSAPWSETAAVIDLGAKSTQIIVLKEGNLKFSREITVAGDTFTQALIGAYEKGEENEKIDEEAAEKAKIKIGLLEEGEESLIEGVPVDQARERLWAVMERFQHEVDRSLTYYKNQFKDYEIDKIFLTGGGSLLKGLPESLRKHLEIPVLFFQSTGPLNFKKKTLKDLFLKDLPFLTTLLGLATQTQPFINLSSHYSVPQIRKSTSNNFLKPVLIGAVPLGLILFFGSLYWTEYKKVNQFQKEIASKKQQLARLNRPSEEMTRLEQEEIQLDKEMEGFPKIEIRKLPISSLFQELSRLVPVNVTLTRFEFSKTQEGRTNLENTAGSPKPQAVEAKAGEVPSALNREMEKREYPLMIQGLVFGSDQEVIATLSEFVRVLNRSEFFKEAKVQATLKSKEFSKGAAEFKIQAKLGQGPSSSGGPS